jgi:hypothetical protein
MKRTVVILAAVSAAVFAFAAAPRASDTYKPPPRRTSRPGSPSKAST